MQHYQVYFFKKLLSYWHQFQCPQEIIAVDAPSADVAIKSAQRQFECRRNIRDWRSYADVVETTESKRTVTTVNPRKIPKSRRGEK